MKESLARKPGWLFTGRPKSVILGQRIEDLRMFLLIRCANIFEKLEDVLKIMLNNDMNDWNDKEIEFLYGL